MEHNTLDTAKADSIKITFLLIAMMQIRHLFNVTSMWCAVTLCRPRQKNFESQVELAVSCQWSSIFFLDGSNPVILHWSVHHPFKSLKFMQKVHGCHPMSLSYIWKCTSSSMSFKHWRNNNEFLLHLTPVKCATWWNVISSLHKPLPSHRSLNSARNNRIHALFQ